MGLFRTNQHDQGWAAAANVSNITNNKLPSHTSSSDNAPTPRVAKKYQGSRSCEKLASLQSPCLVSRVTKLKLNHLNDSSISRCDSRSSSSSAETVRDEIFPYGKGIKPQARNTPSDSLINSEDVLLKYADLIKGNNDKVATSGVVASRELESKSSEKVAGGSISSWGGVKAVAREEVRRKELTPDLELDKVAGVVSSKENRRHATTTITAPQNINKTKMDNNNYGGVLEDDSNSVSTVSGSGIDFFRKFVQRKASSCKDCEEQFRREVLIDRLVSDSINTKAVLGLVQQQRGSSSRFSSSQSTMAPSGLFSNPSTTVSGLSDASHSSPNHSLIVSSLGMHQMEQKARGCASRCKSHRNSSLLGHDDIQSISTKSSLSRSSSISGSGLLFLRNYLKKKKSKSKAGQTDGSCDNNKDDAKNIAAFNIVPVPFPPPSDFYGPAYLPDGGQDVSLDDESSSGRRSSLCSTVADLLNEDFDCDDSELKNLDWEEWDEPLPDEMSYDDLVSVISESFYSEDLDISELCEMDWEGRKTVVANENQVISPDDRNKDKPCEGSRSNTVDYLTGSPLIGSDEILTPTRSKYSGSGYRSRTFMQDLEAELELPPMTPVSDEKEEAVRALSRTIKQYMRTGSNSSYTSSCPDNSSLSASSDKRHSRLSNYHNDQQQAASARYPGKTTTEELERNSRMSVCSSAMSDYLPELVSTNNNSTCVSPQQQQPHRRPLSQLLIYDGHQDPAAAVASPTLTNRPVSQIYYFNTEQHRERYSSRERSKTPSPELRKVENSSSGSNFASQGYYYSQSSSLQQSQHLKQRSIHCGAEAEAGQDSSCSAKHEPAPDIATANEPQPRLLDHIRLRNETTKAANRDSLLCPYTPPLCSSPGLHVPQSSSALGHSPNVMVGARHPFLRHSSVHSTDSGCHLLEEKLPSLSPTPSPRTKIENVLNSNRNKLSSFWEKSISNSVVDVHRSWLPNKDENYRHGFKPFKSSFGSENSLIVTDRLAHFQDMTRRAAEQRNCSSVNARTIGRTHRASTGSDCSDFLDKITLSPLQPRRRESFAEYFV